MEIAIINKSNKYKNNNDIFLKIASAVNYQLQNHVCPSWQILPWSCNFYKDESEIPKEANIIYILDTTDRGKCLGYHDKDSTGKHYANVFVETIFENNGTEYSSEYSISSVISHEACEIICNLQLNCWRQISEKHLIFILQNICDPVQGEAYIINIDNTNIYVSNFVLPSWFDYTSPSNCKLDWNNSILKPFTLCKTGYAIISTDNKVGKHFGKINIPRLHQ